MLVRPYVWLIWPLGAHQNPWAKLPNTTAQIESVEYLPFPLFWFLIWTLRLDWVEQIQKYSSDLSWFGVYAQDWLIKFDILRNWLIWMSLSMRKTWSITCTRSLYCHWQNRFSWQPLFQFLQARQLRWWLEVNSPKSDILQQLSWSFDVKSARQTNNQETRSSLFKI